MNAPQSGYTNMFQSDLSEHQIKMIKKWIKTLKSGKYSQGTGRLYDDRYDRYCCLGVACDVFNFPELNEDSDGIWYLDLSHKAIGLRDKEGSFWDNETARPESLASMNDSNRSFHEIASVIEKHLQEHIKNSK